MEYACMVSLNSKIKLNIKADFYEIYSTVKAVSLIPVVELSDVNGNKASLYKKLKFSTRVAIFILESY